MNPRFYTFIGGDRGPWQVRSITPVTGQTLATVSRVDIVKELANPASAGTQWQLSGVTANERYITRAEKGSLLNIQAAIGRPIARHAALIPIRKNENWWGLTQDERREIFEESSHHIAIGLKYLPAIARRLHHCRDMEQVQPFDFLTFFDFAEADEIAFDQMLAELRQTPEWKYVSREVDIRMTLHQQ